MLALHCSRIKSTFHYCKVLFELLLLLCSLAVGMTEALPAPQGTLCRDVYKEFLHELVVASRRHKDELLTAMLELLLSAPRALLRPAVSTRLCQAAIEFSLHQLFIAALN